MKVITKHSFLVTLPSKWTQNRATGHMLCFVFLITFSKMWQLLSKRQIKRNANFSGIHGNSTEVTSSIYNCCSDLIAHRLK